jgi:hypothetical protein
MSADLLRRAAAKLREHTKAALPGPWEAIESSPEEAPGVWLARHADVGVDVDRDGDARYIALMHPPVALALADWLDETANHITEFAAVAGLVRAGDLTEVDNAALAVARAILREEES